jgi:hypothetical protein
MKTSSRMALTIALGLGAFAAIDLPAQTFPITAQWTMQQQDFSVLKSGVYTDKVKSTKLGTVDLLFLLADAYQTNFPFGAALVLVDYDHFQVQGGDGSILVSNVSDFLTYSDTYAQTNFLYSGKESTITGTRSYVFTYRAAIEFNNPSTNGTFLNFTGTMSERYSRGAVDQTGHRLNTGSLLLNGTGSGTNVNGFFLLSGTIKTPVVKWIE